MPSETAAKIYPLFASYFVNLWFSFLFFFWPKDLAWFQKLVAHSDPGTIGIVSMPTPPGWKLEFRFFEIFPRFFRLWESLRARVNKPKQFWENEPLTGLPARPPSGCFSHRGFSLQRRATQGIKNLFFKKRNIYYPFNCIENSALLTRKNAPGLSAPDPGPSVDLKGWVHHDRTKWQRMTLCCRSHFFPFRPAAMSGAASSAPALCHLASCLVKKEGEEGEHATGNNLPTKKSKCLSPAIRTWPSVFWNETKTRKKFPSCVEQKIFFSSLTVYSSVTH